MKRTICKFARGVTSSAIRPKMHSKRPIHLVLDFDGTITLNDTISQLAWAGYSSQNNSASSETWSEVADLYLVDMKKHTEDYRPNKEERKTLTEELAWLASLEKPEKASFNRVRDSGIFKNVDEHEIDARARQLVSSGEINFRAGWFDLLKIVLSQSSNETSVDILSVSWSKKWLKGCIEEAAVKQGHSSDFDALFSHKLCIHANEICGFRRDEEPNNLQTSRDKVRVLQENIIGRRQRRLNFSSELLVFIGDSLTDLGCIVGADVGCFIFDDPPSRGQTELQETLHRLQIPVDDLSNFSETDLPSINNQGRARCLNIHGLLDVPQPIKIWKVQNFNQVERWLSSWWSETTI